MKKNWTSVVLFVVLVALFLQFCIHAAETLAAEDLTKQPADKVAFKLGYYHDSPLSEKFKDGVVGKDISGIVTGVYTQDHLLNKVQRNLIHIFPPDFEYDESCLQEDTLALRPITWGEFYNTATYKNKRWQYVYIKVDCKTFPLSFAGWEFENVSFISGFDINDARLSNCSIEVFEFEPQSYFDPVTGLRLANEKIPIDNKHFELFASTWNYKIGLFNGISLHNFDLRKASFAYKNISQLYIQGILHDKNNPNLDLFRDSIITGKDGRNYLPCGISKEQLYRTKNYRKKNLVGLKFANRISNDQFENFDLSEQDLSNSILYPISATDYGDKLWSGLDTINLTDSILKGSKIYIYEKQMTIKQLYSTKSYKQKDLTNITFAGNLKDMDLSQQNLSNCNFIGVRLKNVDFTDSVITGVKFGRDLYSLVDGKRMITDYEDKSDITVAQIKSIWNYKNNLMYSVKLPSRIQKELDAEKKESEKRSQKNNNTPIFFVPTIYSLHFKIRFFRNTQHVLYL